MHERDAVPAHAAAGQRAGLLTQSTRWASGPADRALVRRLEELSLNAWPALETTLLDGWLVRFAEGYTRRANSVQPLYPPLGSVRANVEACAAAYAARGQDAIFKLTPASEPAGLDELLTRLGYAREAPTSVQTTELTALGES